MCAHVRVDEDVCELRVYFFVEKSLRFRDLALKIHSLFLTKSEKNLSRNWPGLLRTDGAEPLMAADSLQTDASTNLLLVSANSLHPYLYYQFVSVLW